MPSTNPCIFLFLFFLILSERETLIGESHIKGRFLHAPTGCGFAPGQDTRKNQAMDA